VTAAVQPGDVLLVRSGGFAGAMIRLGAALRDTPNLSNHVCVVHHTDAHGTVWAIEGRPGGVGWRDARAYLESPWTITNRIQPKTDAQRAAVCTTMEAMLGTPYSWTEIVQDAGMALGLHSVWAEKVNGQPPGEIVCSSLAAYAYDKAGLSAPEPADYKHVTPGDWTAWLIANRWTSPGLLYSERRFNGPVRATLKGPPHVSPLPEDMRGAFSQSRAAAICLQAIPRAWYPPLCQWRTIAFTAL
jgi:hypothetical protein